MSDVREQLERLGREIEVGCDAFEPERIEAAVAEREALLLRLRKQPSLARELRTFVTAQGIELQERLLRFKDASRLQLAGLVKASSIRRGYARRPAADQASALDRSG